MQKVQYKDPSDTTEGPSPIIWGDMPIMEMMHDPRKGFYFFDDFVDVLLPGTQTTEIAWGPYKVFNTGSPVWQSALTVNSIAVNGGIISCGLDTDNDSGSLGVQAQSFRMSGLKATDKKLCFEARIAVSPITTNGVGFALGLAETSLFTFATAVPLNASDAFTNTGAFIGFQYLEDDTTTCSSAYSDRSAAAATEIGSNEVTLANLTFTKLGFIYDPEDLTNTVRFFQDGAKCGTVLSSASLVALTNLDAALLGPMVSVIADSSGTSGLFYMDWWRCAQLR